MKKIIAFAVAGLLVSAALSGCEMPEEQLVQVYPQTEPTVVTEATEAPVVEATEPVATEGEPETGWEAGAEVWFVEHDEYGDGWPYPGVVVEAGAEYLIVSRGWDTEGELVAAHLADCYRTDQEAWAACGKEPLE